MAVHRAWVPRAAAKAGAASGGAQRPRARPALAPPPASRGAPKSGVASAKKEAQSGAVLASEPRAAPQEAAQEAPAAGGELTLVRPLGGSRFKLRVEPHTRTLGDFLLNLLRQRVKKARKLQKLAAEPETRDAATDDDAVRELRLVLRRLRNTLMVASFALDLPAEAEAHKLSRTLRKLGAPRDTEAVATTLRLAAGLPASSQGDSAGSDSTLSAAERDALDALLGELDGARRRGFAEAVDCLGNRDVRRVLAALRSFHDKPAVLPFGNRDESDAVSRALTRVAGQLFAHDGWELASLGGAEKEPWEQLLGVSSPRCEQIHSLRKAIREMRYAMEAFEPLYDTLDAEATRHFKAQLGALVELQTHIGTMHDVQVCIQVLADTCGGGGGGAAASLGAHVDSHGGKGKGHQAKRAFPQLTAALRARFDDAWVEFQKGRERMLSREGQQQLYAALLGSL